jgi:hypothetical protein
MRRCEDEMLNGFRCELAEAGSTEFSNEDVDHNGVE